MTSRGSRGVLALESDDTGAAGGRRSLTGSSAAHCSCNAAHVFFLFPRIGTTSGVSRSTVCVQGLARAAGEEQREFSELVVLTFPQKSDLLSLTCIYRASLNSRAHSRGARAARITYTYASEVCSHASMFVCVCTYMERVSECE